MAANAQKASRFVGQIATFANRAWSVAVGRDLDELARRVTASLSKINTGIATATPTSPTGKTAAEGVAETLLRSDATIEQGIVSAKGDILTHDGTTAERFPNVGVFGYMLAAQPFASTGLNWIPFDSVSILTKTANYSADPADSVILVDATAGAVTITLPDPTLFNTRITIKKIDASAHAVNIVSVGGELIDGSAAQALAAQWQSVTVVCTDDEAAWFIVAFNV